MTEYIVRAVTADTYQELERLLNEQASYGWELEDILTHGPQTLLIFSRRPRGRPKGS